jgi:hypothetical protein
VHRVISSIELLIRLLQQIQLQGLLGTFASTLQSFIRKFSEPVQYLFRGSNEFRRLLFPSLNDLLQHFLESELAFARIWSGPVSTAENWL